MTRSPARPSSPVIITNVGSNGRYASRLTMVEQPKIRVTFDEFSGINDRIVLRILDASTPERR